MISVIIALGAMVGFDALAYFLFSAGAHFMEALPMIIVMDAVAAALVMFHRMWRRPETAAVIKYMLIGAATTVVNYVSYWLIAHPLRDACGIEFNNSTWIAFATTLSWLAAVIFSFFPNKAFAFGSHDWSRETVLREGRTFFFSRVLTFAFDLIFMVVAVELGARTQAQHLPSKRPLVITRERKS